ncbi:helix-turn-helix domain-containing protein [Streptomyces qinzhouensis]|nr:helix-turn-helix transcriptional regulator [Streptomyces qinzhouensis]
MSTTESFGQLLRRLRVQAGRTQEEQAEAVNTASGRDTLTRREISRYETGETVPTKHTVTQIARSCGVAPEVLLNAAAIARSRRKGEMHQGDKPPSPELGTPTVELAAAVSLDFADFIAPWHADDDHVCFLRDSLARIAGQYVCTPVLPLFDDLVGVRDETFGLLRRRQKPHHARELYVLAGASCLLLAHASQNLGNSHAALAQIRTASTCAQQIDHKPLRAWAAATAALIAEWSAQPTRALQLAEKAIALAPAGHSRIRAFAIQARTAARTGDQRAADAALTRMATAQVEHPDTDELVELGGIFTFPPAKQDYYTGTTFSLLGRYEEAEKCATRAVNQYRHGPPAARSYGDEALATIDIALARIRQDDIDTAARRLQPILALPSDQRIQQLALGLRPVTRALEESPALHTSGATDLLDLTRKYQVLGAPALPSL